MCLSLLSPLPLPLLKRGEGDEGEEKRGREVKEGERETKMLVKKSEDGKEVSGIVRRESENYTTS